jgi:N-acyl homoserine lactone hydrolase
MFILPLGTCRCGHEVVAPGLADGVPMALPVSAYLIRLDDGTTVLVDTGMSRIHIDDPRATFRGTPIEDALLPDMAPADDIGSRLQSLDVAAADVDYVINTHLHFDHAGNNDLFPRATVVVQREHHRVAVANSSFPNQYWNLPGTRFELVDGERELLPGLESILTPGHAPGHQSVLVRLPESGAMVICGDAIYVQANLDHDNWLGQADPAAARVSAHKLVDIAARENAVLLYGHDADQASRYPRAPHAYR